MSEAVAGAEPSVRRARPDEAGALAALAAATFALACPPDMAPERIEAFIATVLSPECFERYLADRQRTLLVADDGRRLLGYAMLVAGEPGDADVRAALVHRPTVELSKIYVLPEAHGTGAAQALMARSVERARELGAAGIWLGVNQRNARAQRFYAKSGFAVAGTKRFLVGDRYEDDFVMEQQLS